MAFRHAILIAVSAALLATTPALALDTGSAVVITKSELQWKELGNGVAAAPVSGDMEKGESRFFLKYPAGFVTSKHHHDADHYVTLVSGNITLIVEGKDHKLGPGSYFALTDKVPHTAKVEGKEDAVFFIQADGPWNVVVDK